MQAGCLKAKNYVANLNSVGTEHLALLHHANRSTSNVILVLTKQPWVLSGFATNKRNVHLFASLSNAANNVRDALRVELSGCDVIGHE